MTTRRKRKWIYRVAMPTLRFMLPDKGAERCIEMLRSGGDAAIEDAWQRFFHHTYHEKNPQTQL